MLSKRLSRLVKIGTGTNSGAGEELLLLEGRLERFVHFCALTVRHFVNNRCLIRAEALAYTSLLALIPLLAVVVGITSTLLPPPDEAQIYHVIDKFVSSIMPPATITNNSNAVMLELTAGLPMPQAPTNRPGGTSLSITSNTPQFMVNTNPATFESANNLSEDTRVVAAQKEAAKTIHNYIQNALKSKIGLAGMVVFVFIAIAMLRRMEETFNDIWGVTKGRKWWQQISNHFTIITLGPVLLLAASTLASGHYLLATRFLVEKMPFLGRAIQQFLPLIVLWLGFAVLYMVVPNTRVRFSAAFIGGVIAGTLWYLNNVFAFFYVSRVITNSEIYGKLGLVPVFMLGLYLSWVILLFGAQVAYAWQNRAAYLQDKIADNVNQRGREFVALRIMTLLGQRFQNGFPPMPVIELSAELGVPSRLTQRILRILAAAHLVTEVAGDENAYLPARPLDTINAHHILSALRTGSGRELLMDSAPALAGIFGDFARIEAAERTASEKISVLALVQHLPAQFKLETPKGMVQAETKSTPEAKFETQISKIEPVELTPTMAANAEAEAVKEISVEKKAVHRETVKPNETEFPL
ncbi:MAG: YhjD/YihY/BrkB family envelope integrity protein [Verrucomicrobiota bacterium]